MTLPPSVQLRPIAPGDREVLSGIYASTREEELASVGWSAGQKAQFLRQQFEAQQRHYHGPDYSGALFQMITVDGEPAGRWYLHPRADEIRIMDLALLPPFRGRGIGTALIRGLFEQGAQSGRRITLHVETMNRALGLYERLGFQRVSNNGVYWLLEWTPKPASTVSVGRTPLLELCA